MIELSVASYAICYSTSLYSFNSQKGPVSLPIAPNLNSEVLNTIIILPQKLVSQKLKEWDSLLIIVVSQLSTCKVAKLEQRVGYI